MMKEYIIAIIGLSTLLLAAVAAYGVTTVSTEMQDNKPAPVTMPDYSDELSALSMQVAQIKSDVASLNTIKTDIYKIQEKLVDLEKQNTQQVQQPQTIQQSRLLIDLDKYEYLPGETVKIIVTGAEPQKMAQVQFLDDGFILLNNEAWSDSTGTIMYGLKLSSALPAGTYEIRLVADAVTESQQIRIRAPSSTDTSNTASTSFTVQTGKSIYRNGEIIDVSGIGKPNTSVVATLTSPAGKVYTANTSTQSDGTYVLFYSPSQPYDHGKWYVTASNEAKTVIVYLIIQ
ncbi:MAG: hypothetical protein EPO62_05940 [Candidatus Nitrosotenuis sp.]|nr:MAG: hypothetical protein EPO62_05940 [Candidatus Nitrosotenuis sp.]